MIWVLFCDIPCLITFCRLYGKCRERSSIHKRIHRHVWRSFVNCQLESNDYYGQAIMLDYRPFLFEHNRDVTQLLSNRRQMSIVQNKFVYKMPLLKFNQWWYTWFNKIFVFFIQLLIKIIIENWKDMWLPILVACHSLTRSLYKQAYGKMLSTRQACACADDRYKNAQIL